jgi:hypothetical protein
MSQDGKGQVIPRKIVNDRPIQNNVECPCGGTIYASPRSKFATCSNGETRCIKCLRPARKFGRGGLTCGVGCRAN